MRKKEIIKDDAKKTKHLNDFGFKKVDVNKKEMKKFHREAASLLSGVRQEVIFSEGVFQAAHENDLLKPQLSFKDLQILTEIIKKHIPTIANGISTLTIKRVIDIDYTRRAGGPSDIIILIRVNFSGLISEKCEELRGFYVLTVDPACGDVMVEKLKGGEFIYKGNMDVCDKLIDYRDLLAKIISEKYLSRYQFCRVIGIDEAFLSNVLNKKKHFSLKNLEEILAKIGYEISMVKK